MLTAQAAFATDFAKKVMDNDPLLPMSPDLISDLTALRHILTDSDERNESNKITKSQPTLSQSVEDGFQLPRIHLAMAALQKLRGNVRLTLIQV